MRTGVLLKLLLVTIVIFGPIRYIFVKQALKSILCEKFDLAKYKGVNFFPQSNNFTETIPHNLLSEKDYNRLIDIPFNFTILNGCNTQSIKLLILVHSSATNFRNRETIRDTWGKNDEDTKIFFILGATSEEIQVKIDKENYIYHDIIQGSFIDSYRNMSYKHQMCLKFVTYHCRQVKYVIKIDDDVFINTPSMKNFLIKDISPHGSRNMIMCPMSRYVTSFRTYRSKWRVTWDEYPYKDYPTYCLGWVIIYSPDILFKFYQEAQKTDFFWIDDVLMTGIVAKNLNFVDHVDISPLTLSKEEVSSLVEDTRKQYRPFLVGCANMNDVEIRNLWKYIINSQTRVTEYDEIDKC